MSRLDEIFDDAAYDAISETWYRRMIWVYACRPPYWRFIKYRRWRALEARIDEPFDAFFAVPSPHPGRE